MEVSQPAMLVSSTVRSTRSWPPVFTSRSPTNVQSQTAILCMTGREGLPAKPSAAGGTYTDVGWPPRTRTRPSSTADVGAPSPSSRTGFEKEPCRTGAYPGAARSVRLLPDQESVPANVQFPWISITLPRR
jgi:hypothetical protein